MIDSILSAPYPDATPLTVDEAHSLLLHHGDMKHLLPDGSTQYHYKYIELTGAPGLQDAFINYPYGQHLLWKRSGWALAGFAATALLLLVPTGLNLWFNWGRLSGDAIFWVNVVLVGLLLGAAWCLFHRWMKFSLTLALSLDLDEKARMLAAVGSNHVQPAALRSYTSEQREHFYANTPHQDHYGLGFRVPFVVTGRGEAVLERAWRERSRLRDEAAALVAHGPAQDRNSSAAKAFDGRAVTAVKLEKHGVLLNIAIGLFAPLVYFGGAAVLLALGAWIIDTFGRIATWPFVVGIGLSFGGLMLGGMMAIWLVTLVFRLIAGATLLEVFSGFRLDHRVRVRFADGRWMTLLKTPRQVVAVELYNLVVRDVRRPAE